LAVTIVFTGSGFAGFFRGLRFSRWAASTSAAPILFAGLESMAGAFGYLPKRLQVRDSRLFAR
jgi:hypothetical protein